MKLYAARDGVTVGPFSETEIRTFIKGGMLPKDVLVCPEGEEQWRQLWPERPAAAPSDEFGEQVIFSQGAVTVTRSRFVVGAQTYAIRNITSVGSATIPAPLGVGWVVIIIGLFLVFAGVAVPAPSLGFVGIVTIVIGFAIMSSRKPLYAVALKTSGGDLRAITHASQPFIQAIVAALNQAIIVR